MSNPNFKSGDWTCPSCQAHNFASRTKCFKCSVAPHAGSFYSEVTGKSAKEAQEKNKTRTKAEIEAIKENIKQRKSFNPECKWIDMHEGSFEARKWLEAEGFSIQRYAVESDGCGMSDAYDSCDCSRCKNAGKLTGEYKWTVSWNN